MPRPAEDPVLNPVLLTVGFSPLWSVASYHALFSCGLDLHKRISDIEPRKAVLPPNPVPRIQAVATHLCRPSSSSGLANNHTHPPSRTPYLTWARHLNGMTRPLPTLLPFVERVTDLFKKLAFAGDHPPMRYVVIDSPHQARITRRFVRPRSDSEISTRAPWTQRWESMYTERCAEQLDRIPPGASGNAPTPRLV